MSPSLCGNLSLYCINYVTPITCHLDSSYIKAKSLHCLLEKSAAHVDPELVLGEFIIPVNVHVCRSGTEGLHIT